MSQWPHRSIALPSSRFPATQRCRNICFSEGLTPRWLVFFCDVFIHFVYFLKPILVYKYKNLQFAVFDHKTLVYATRSHCTVDTIDLAHCSQSLLTILGALLFIIDIKTKHYTIGSHYYTHSYEWFNSRRGKKHFL